VLVLPQLSSDVRIVAICTCFTTKSLQNGGCSVIKCIHKKYFSKVSITFKPCATGLETAPCPLPLGKPVHDNEIGYEFRNKLARRQPQMFPSRQKT